MANMSTAYRGPNPSLIALTTELRGFYGNPVRTYEFVTGYKSPDNFSGHNPDSNGVVHAVDIFTDDYGNIPEVEGRALAERLRMVGAATNRFSYLIHDMSAGAPQPMIAGQFNGWVWQTYGGADAHSDHIHVSIADGYWGDPCAVSASVTNDTSRWGVTGGAVPQSGNITPIIEPIQEDDMANVPQDQWDLAMKILASLSDNVATKKSEAAEHYSVKKFAQATANDNGNRVIMDVRGQIAGLIEALKQANQPGNAPIDLDAVLEAAKKGAAQAIAEGVVKVDINVAGSPDTTPEK